MSTADARAVLLARPGEARDRLRTALEQAGIDVVLEADPLAAGPDEIAATGACNLVIAVDAEVEDALERFDPLLADARYRILFEEAGVVNARDGWDVARWSRHLGAKLLGHGDVLPSGHEEDGDAASVADAAIQASAPVVDAADNDVDDDAAAAEESTSAGMPEAPVEAASIIETEAVSLDAGELPTDTASSLEMEAVAVDSRETPAGKVRADAPFAFTVDEVEHASDAVDPDDVAFGVAPVFETADTHWPQDEVAAVDDAAPTEPAVQLPEPPTDAALDWTRFQDFEAVNELPAANAPQSAEADYRAALAPLEESGLSHDDAYQQIQDEATQFDRAAPADRWQDFERPTTEPVDVQAPATVAPPEAPSAWTLSDEAFEAAPATAAPRPDLNRLESRISSLSLVEEDAEPDDATPSTPAPPVPAFEARDSGLSLEGDAPAASEGAIVLVGGIGGPDPLRQILQQLKPGLGVPVLVQQWLDGGQYDRLVRQMDRATELPVELAVPGQPLEAAHVYIVPVAVGVERDAGGTLQFTQAASRGFADVLSGLPAGSSGVFLLSGAGEEFVEPVLRFQQSGGRIYAQAAEGCYDHAVPALMISRGAEAHLPAGLATQLAARWQQQDSE